MSQPSQDSMFAPVIDKSRWSEDVSRGKDNEASKKAHARLVPHKATLQDKVFALIEWAPNGMTMYELSDAMKKPVHSLSGRLTELAILKRIHVSGERLNKFGNMCSVYKVGK